MKRFVVQPYLLITWAVGIRHRFLYSHPGPRRSGSSDRLGHPRRLPPQLSVARSLADDNPSYTHRHGSHIACDRLRTSDFLAAEITVCNCPAGAQLTCHASESRTQGRQTGTDRATQHKEGRDQPRWRNLPVDRAGHSRQYGFRENNAGQSQGPVQRLVFLTPL